MSNVLKVCIFLILLCCWLLQRMSNYYTLYSKYLQWAFFKNALRKSVFQLRGLMVKPLGVDVKNSFCEQNFCGTHFSHKAPNSLFLSSNSDWGDLIVSRLFEATIGLFYPHELYSPPPSDTQMPQRCFCESSLFNPGHVFKLNETIKSSLTKHIYSPALTLPEF